MADEKDRPAFGGFDGGTAGTGAREAASGSRKTDQEPGEAGGSRGAGDASSEEATGRQSDGKIAETADGVGEPVAIDPGDPGGMGGAKASTHSRGRPPGGVSPMDGDQSRD